MKRALKVLSVLFVVVVALCVAGVAVLLTLDLNDYKDTIAGKAKEATGRDLAITGDIAIDWSMAPTLRVQGVHLANAEWGSRKEMLSLDLLEAQIDLAPLLNGRIVVPRVVVKGLDLLAETNADGKGNWEMAAAAAPAEPATTEGAPIIPVVAMVVVENVKVAYRDGKTGQVIEAVLDSLQASSDDPSKPVVISLKGTVNGAAVAVAGSVGAPAALMANESYGVSLKAKALEVVAGIEGAIARPMDAKGIDLALSADIADLARTLKAAAAIVPNLGTKAETMPPTAIAFAGKASDTADGYALKGITLTIGDSDLGGEVSVALAPRLKAKATLSSNKLDLNALSALGGGRTAAPAPATAGDGRVFSADPLPLDGLKAADADIALKAARTILPGGAELGDLDVRLALAGGRLGVELVGVKIGGGHLRGDVALDGAAVPASLDIDLVGKGIVLGEVLKQMNLKDALQGGATDVSVSLKGKGASVRQLMAGLGGGIVVDTGEGRLNNRTIDVVGGDMVTGVFGALNPFGEKKQYSVLKCAAVKVTIADGVATIDKGIAAETESTNVVGAGTIDLRAETIDLGIKPEASGGVGLSLGGAASMVRLGGTLAKPGITLDALETAKAAASTAAAIMTFGLSKGAEALVNTATRDDHPCATALGKAPPAEAAPAKASGQQGPAEPAKKEEPKSGIGSAVEGMGKLFGFGGK